ncbi:carbohydrate porin [Halothiobacillus sp. DCM-1]|uniref:carbohydrate porin n=1 Tax=Halothiobacillus sp. DCM-1 TaxID=3112558 RepID=UPI003247964D
MQHQAKPAGGSVRRWVMLLALAGLPGVGAADTVSNGFADQAPTAASRALPPSDESMPGIHWFGHWDTDALRNLSGGRARGGAIDSVAVGGVGLDGAQLGLPDSYFSASLMAVRTGQGTARLLGTLTDPSNIEGNQSRLVLDTAIWQQRWLHRPGFGLLTRVGVFDLSGEFDTTDNAAQLLNSSFGMDPSMTGNFTPSTFPLNGSGAVAVLGSAEDPDHAPFALKLGISQGEVDQQTHPFAQGVLNLLEAQWRPNERSAIKWGVWRRRFSDTPALSGSYLSAETELYHAGVQSVEGFVRGSVARGTPQGVDGTRRYLGAGMNWQAPFIQRPHDTLVLGAGRLQQTAGNGQEHFVELGYIVQITDNIYLQPDLQYLRPADASLPGTWVGILRLHIE